MKLISKAKLSGISTVLPKYSIAEINSVYWRISSAEIFLLLGMGLITLQNLMLYTFAKEIKSL